MKTNSLRYEYYIEIAQMIIKAFDSHVNAEKEISPIQQQTIVVKQTSTADELLKYKQLVDAGLMTTEEFEQQKKTLLGGEIIPNDHIVSSQDELKVTEQGIDDNANITKSFLEKEVIITCPQCGSSDIKKFLL